MKISKRQLRRIIREAYEMDHMAVENFLVQKAREYHQDRALDIDGDGIPDAPAIRELLQDDIFELAGDWSPQDFEDLIDELSEAPPEDPPFRAPDPATHKRLRQQTRAQGGYSGKGAWKSRTPN